MLNKTMMCMAAMSLLFLFTSCEGNVVSQDAGLSSASKSSLNPRSLLGLSSSKPVHLATSNPSSLPSVELAAGGAKLVATEEGSTQKLPLLFSSGKTDHPIVTADRSTQCRGIKFYDTTGTLSEGTKNCAGATVADCVTDGEMGCVTTAQVKSAAVTGLAAKIVAGKSVAGIAGTAGTTEAPANCSADGQVACVATAAYTAAQSSGLAVKIISGNTVGGVSGTATAESHSSCAADGATGCVAVTGYPAAKVGASNVDERNIKSGITIAGITGLYPSSTHKLSSASGGVTDVTDGNLNSLLQSASSFEWWSSDGSHYTSSGDVDLANAGNIVSGVTILGTLGTASAGSAPDPWDVRAGATVGGVTGKLQANCRNGGSTLTFGMGATKTATVANGTDTLTVTAHGYNTGDPVQIDYATTPSGLAVGTIYYVIKTDNDNFKLATSVANAFVPTAVNITADGSGVVVWAYGQSPKAATVDDAANTLTVTGHGYSSTQLVRISAATFPSGLSATTDYYVISVNANTIKLATNPTNANATTAVDITAANGVSVYVYAKTYNSLAVTDTIDDYNYGSTALTDHPWGTSDYFCGGVESTVGDNNVWKDVTTDGSSAASSCTATTANCTMKDKISGLKWTKTQSVSMMWGKALDYCKNLNFNNITSGWRLPTQKELMEAYTHGLRSAASTNWITLTEMANYFWTSSTYASVPSNAWTVIPAYGLTSNTGKSFSNSVTCVQ